MKRFGGLMALSALVALSACSSASSHDDEEHANQTSSAITKKCLDELAIASTSQGVCSSVWEYVPECHEAKPGPECGLSVQGYEKRIVNVPRTCEAPKFGLASIRDLHEVREGDSWSSIEVGDPTCHEWANEHLEILRIQKKLEPRMPEYQAMRVTNVRSRWLVPKHQGIVHCEYDITQVPTWNSGTDAAACGVSIVVEEDLEKPIQNVCRASDHPLVAASECDTRPERSERGLSRSQFLASRPKLLQALQSTTPGIAPAEPICLSCDDVPIVRPDGTIDGAAVAERYQCLKGNLARYVNTTNAAHPTAADVGISADIVRGLKLLGEVYGEYLTASDRESVASLYLRAPAPTCSPELPTSHGKCRTNIGNGDGGPALATAYGQYLRCEALLEHGGGPTVALEMKGCIDAVESVRTAMSAAPVADCDPVRPRFEYELLVAGLGRGVPEIPLTEDPSFDAKSTDLKIDLRRRLAAIDAWYSAEAANTDAKIAAGTTDGGAELRAGLARDTEAVLGAFWAPLLGTSPAAVAAGLPTLEQRASVVERAVLQAAFPTDSTRAPLPHAPLLLVTMDALDGLAARLESLGAVHDLACRFRGGGCSARTSTLSELWKALANLNDGPQLSASLSSAKHLGAEPWKDALVAVATGHTALEAAARDALSRDTGAPTTTTLLEAAGSVRYARAATSFGRFVSEAARRHASYATTGLFATFGEGEVADAFTRDKRALATIELERTKADLDAARAAHVAGELSALSALATQIENDQENRVILGRLDLLARRFDKLTEEIAAVRERDAAEEARFGSFMTALEKRIDEETSRPDFAIQRDLPRTFLLSARDARFRVANGTPTLLGMKVADPTASLSIQAGEIVNLQVSGAFSPTCALRGLTLPDGKVLDEATLATLRTGPEGFAMTVTAQGSQVTSQQTSSTNTQFWGQSNTSKVCASASFYAGFPLGGAVGPSMGVNAEECDVRSSGTTKAQESSTTTGTATGRQLTAAFAAGIRAPNTPMPWAPAGSLIAVATKPGSTNLADVIDMRVVQAPFTSLVFEESADISFVVNDSADCGTTVPADALTIQRTSLIPLGSALKALSAPMNAALEHIRSRRDAIVAQGQMLPTDAAQLQLEAQAIVSGGCHCEVGQLPQFVQQFFATWLGKEIARTERQVAIAAKEYERRLLVKEAVTVRAELEANSEVARIQRRMSSLALRNVDPANLRAKMREVADIAVTFVRPVLRLRLPAALSLIAEDRTTQSQADALLDLAEMAGSASAVDIGVAAQAESTFVGSLITKIRAAQLAAPPPSESIVALRIPRYLDAAPSDTSAAACAPYPRPLGAPEPTLKALDCAKSRAIWSQVLDTTRATALFDLEPNDLYASPGTTTAPLFCNVSAPLISHMAVIVATSNEAFNISKNMQHAKSRLDLGDRMVFTMTTGPETYRLVPNELGRGQSATGDVRLLFSSSDAMLAPFMAELAHPIGAASMTKQAGFSPFTTYTLDVVSLRGQFSTPDMRDAYELALVFNIEPYPAIGGSVRGVPVCSSSVE